MSFKRKKWAVAFLILLFTIGAWADSKKGVKIEFYPSSLKLPSRGITDATLVVINNEEKVIKNVQVEHHKLPGVKVVIVPPVNPTVSPGSTSAWKLKISLDKSGAVSGDIYFQVSYTIKGKNEKEFRDIVLNKLTVANRDYKEADEVAKVEVLSSLAELKDFRPGYIYLQVKNISVVPIKITNIIVAERPEFIILRPSKDTSPILEKRAVIPYLDEHKQVPAGESRIFPIHVSAEDRVRPGKHLLIFNVFFNRTVNGETQTGSLMAKHEIEVNVFGEKEVLGAFTNVSSFLILPGFLMIVIAVMMWKLLVPLPQKEILKINLTSPEFWSIAIGISLLMAWIVYPFLTSIIPGIGRRDFLSGYGFHDIIWMWLFSFAIGGLFSVISSLVIRNLQRRKAAKERVKLEKAIKQTDIPMGMLKKLVENKVSAVRYREAEIKSSKMKGFIVEKDYVNKKKYWLSPRITIWWYEDDKDLRGKVGDLIEKKKDLKELVEMLEQGETSGKNEKKGIVKVEWRKKQGEVEKLTEVAVSELDVKNEWKDIFSHETKFN